MAICIGPIILLLAAPSLINGATIEITKTRSVEGMIYLGSFVQPEEQHTSLGFSTLTFKEHYYYVSGYPTTHPDASTACRNIESNATLLSVETLEEKLYIDGLLEPYNFGDYWMSAMYDGAGILRWSNNKPVDECWAPWASGYPDIKNSQTRVYLSYQNRLNSFWRTKYGTNFQKFICEIIASN